jgi:hypothetical protein
VSSGFAALVIDPKLPERMVYEKTLPLLIHRAPAIPGGRQVCFDRADRPGWNWQSIRRTVTPERPGNTGPHSGRGNVTDR